MVILTHWHDVHGCRLFLRRWRFSILGTPEPMPEAAAPKAALLPAFTALCPMALAKPKAAPFPTGAKTDKAFKRLP